MKQIRKICRRTCGPRAARTSSSLVVSLLVVAATSPSYGQITISQSSYVKIKDNLIFRQTNASQMISPIPGGQSISFGAVDSDSVTLCCGFVGQFNYFTSVLGSGTARYGSLGGKIDTNSSSTPDFVSTVVGGTTYTSYNDGLASANGVLDLGFTDTGVVTSSTLAVGAPVTLSFTYSLESLGYLIGRPVNSDNRFTALYMASATDISAVPETGTYVAFADNGLQTLSLNTVVGHTLRLNAALQIGVRAQAGRDFIGSTEYYSQVFGNDDASHTASFFLDAPDGVAFAATSGHDYTVIPGDYNRNGIVDAADYTVWRNGLDANYIAADYDTWKAPFGESNGSGSGANGSTAANVAVPEPANAVLLVIGSAVCGTPALRRQRLRGTR